jgi:hypothetical protein
MPTTTTIKRRPARSAPDSDMDDAPIVHIQHIMIPKLQKRVTSFTLDGTAPYMQLRFSEKAMHKMQATQEAGTQARSKKTRDARDFAEDYRQAMHLFADGRHGIPAAAFRNAMISACRVVGFKMTMAKLSIFVQADGEDVVDGTPLIEIYGTPEQTILPVRNATGVADLRVRPMWRQWHVQLTIGWDEGQFSLTDIANLLERAGEQVGIGEGRPDSRNSAGLDYGKFKIREGQAE